MFDVLGNVPAPETCGDLVALMQAVIRAAPEYLPSRDTPFLTCMLAELNDYVPEHVSERDGTRPFRELPLRLLELSLHEWVESAIASENPLLSTYRLAACEWIDAHVAGHYFHEPHGELRSVLKLGTNEGRLPFLHDSSFKRHVSVGCIGGRVVRFEVPSDARLVLRSAKDVNLPGTGIFRVERSHLSQNQPGENAQFDVVQNDLEQFNLLDNFAFFGQLAVDGSVFESRASDEKHEHRPMLTGHLPIAWLTHASSERCHVWECWAKPDVPLPTNWFAIRCAPLLGRR
ncbi:MAG TPA: hypothetical protein VK524_09485, partial [Polyangiaceae bacterium]|nr:hypothetical protein [Polyangiaceae bacterium]